MTATGVHPQRRWRGRRRQPGVIGLVAVLLSIVLVACSGSGAPTASGTAIGSVAANSGTVAPPALGGTADTTASCASSTGAVNAEALAPGSARTTVEGVSATTGQVGESFWDIARFLATGVAAFLTGPSSLVGWAMGELGGAGQGGISPELNKKLNALSGQLHEITNQLNTIETQLSGVTNLIKDSTYQTAIKSITANHVAPILSMWQQYCDIVATGDTDAATLDQLTNDVLDSANGIRPHITAIAQTFQGSDLTGNVPLPGMFAQFVIDQNLAGTFDDTVAYKKYMQPYTQYFVSLGVMGMTLMVEAFHQRGDIKGAEAALNDMWSDIRTIYQAGGSPITDERVVFHIPSKTAWSRQPVCFTAQFDSADADTYLDNWKSGDDPAQLTLAMNASTAQANQNPTERIRSKIAAEGIGLLAPDASPASSVGGSNTPTYVFAKGDSVCATLFYELTPDSQTYLPTMIKESNLPSTAISRTGSGWRGPGEEDFKALLTGGGSDSPQDYLTANGFNLPVDSPTSVRALAYGYWGGGQTGYFEPTTGTFTCLFNGTCTSGVWVTLPVIATPDCWLGSAEYQGLPTDCGTYWLDQAWPASPPPPAAGPTTTPATTSAGG